MKNKIGKLFIGLGLVCMFLASALFLYNSYEDHQAGIAIDIVVPELKQDLKREIIEHEDMDSIEVDGHEYIGYLTIENLDLNLPIMYEWSYPGLKVAPGRMSGTVTDGNLVFLAHNYQRHFKRIKELNIGDVVAFEDVHHQVYEYEVAHTEILRQQDVEEMIHSDYDLTLFTCTKDGKARYCVRCKIKK